jgi:hypothetical protein
MRLRLYTKPACSLCDDLKRDLLALQPEFGFVIEEHNIEDEAESFARFRYLIPVLEIEGRELLYPPHTGYQLYQALCAAQSQASKQ